MYAYKTRYTLCIYNKPRLTVQSADFTIDEGKFTAYEDTIAITWDNINAVLENKPSLPFGKRVKNSSAKKGKVLFLLDNHNMALEYREWDSPHMTAQLIVNKMLYTPSSAELEGYRHSTLARHYIKEKAE